MDFTQGLEAAVRQTAELLNCADKAGPLLETYAQAMQKTRDKMKAKPFAGKVVILKGTYQAATGKSFLQVEAPGGYADRFLLKPMGCENVGAMLFPVEKKPSKGHVSIRKLDGLMRAAPDAIVLTGDAIATQTALAEAIKKNPSLAKVPAIKAHAIYTLPAYVDSSLLEYPHILLRWANALTR